LLTVSWPFAAISGKLYLRGASNSIEFSLELTRKTEVNQQMTYTQKFRALGLVIASAVAVATVAPALATPPSRGTDGSGTDMTGPGTDGSGTDGSGGSHGGGGNKHEPKYVNNPFNNPQVKVLILQLLQAYQQAKTSNNFSTYKANLPAVKAQLLALGVLVKSGSHSSLESPKPEPGGSTVSGDGKPQFVAVQPRSSGNRPAHTYRQW
jgi:hypothetical protein